MLTKRQTRAFFYANSGIFALIFLGLTVDTHRQVRTLTNEANNTPDVIAEIGLPTDENFRDKVRVAQDHRRGLTLEQYIDKMDRAGRPEPKIGTLRLLRALTSARRFSPSRAHQSAAMPS